MKVAVVGSRNLDIDISEYIPKDCTCIISGGATGIDSIAAKYAKDHDIKLIEFLPDYRTHGRAAPLKRNTQIIEAADFVLAIWDGQSRGTQDSINKARMQKKELKVINLGQTSLPAQTSLFSNI
jgi:hypothetical protein